MKKQIIAVDIDDVLGSTNDAIRVFINDYFGLNHTPEDYNIEADYEKYWETVWGVDDDEGTKRWRAFLDNGGIENLERHPEVLDVLLKLKNKYDLVIVTARRDEFAAVTKKWLQQHFPDVFQDAHFVPVFRGENRKTKAMVCIEIGADYLIDDNYEHCVLAAEAGLTALLFGDFGWNRNKPLPKNVARVKDCHEVEQYFDSRDRN